MDAARTVPLAQVAALNPRLLQTLSDGTPISFVSMAAMSAEEAKVTLATDRPYSEVRKGYTYFETGDVLVAKITPCFENGKIAEAVLPRQYGFGSTEFHVVRPKVGTLDGRYLHHFLRQAWIRVEGERRMTGSGGQRRVPADFLAELEIPLPPLPEQRRIAAILDQADALRVKHREALAQLDSLTQSIFIEMFGRATTDQLGWPNISLSEVADVLTGYAFKSDEYVEPHKSTVRLCRGANVMPGRVDWQDLACWPKAGYDKLSTFSLEVGDIVIAMDRPWIAEGFKIARIAPSDCPALLVQRVARVRAKEIALDDFVYALLSQPEFARHCRPTETTIPHISPKEIRSFELRLPPLPLQQTFATRIQAVEALKATHRAALAELDALFASLQHRAFAGQLL